MDDVLGIVVAEDDSDCASACVYVRVLAKVWERLCIERQLRRHLKENKRDNKQVEEKSEDVMKEECESVWKLCDTSVDLHRALWSNQLRRKVVSMQKSIMSKRMEMRKAHKY